VVVGDVFTQSSEPVGDAFGAHAVYHYLRDPSQLTIALHEALKLDFASLVVGELVEADDGLAVIDLLVGTSSRGDGLRLSVL